MPSAPDRPSAFIVIHGPGHEGTRLTLREGITSFGRLPSNDVILLGDLVSRHHSRITYFEGRGTLQDLGSHNGSWVNNEKVSTRVLKHGDVVRVGNFRIAFHEGGSQEQLAFEETTNGEPPLNTSLRPERGGKSTPRRQVVPETERDEMPDLSALSPSQSVMVQRIERARAGEDTVRQRSADERALMLLYRASEALGTAANVKSYLEDILALVTGEISAEYALFLRAAGEGMSVLAARDARGAVSQAPYSVAVARWVTQKNFAVTSEDVSTDFRFDRQGSLRDTRGVRAVACAPVAQGDRVLGAIYCSREAPPFSEEETDVLCAVAHLAALGIERAESRGQALSESMARELLSRFFSADVVEQLMRQKVVGGADGPRLDGKTATIVAVDVPGLSALYERVPGDALTEFLSGYLELLAELAGRHRGTLSELTQSAATLSFGAPFSYGNDAARAVTAVLELRDGVDVLVKGHPSVGALRLRAGVHTGWVLSGTVGAARRLAYTTLGETVGTACRLETSAAPGAILIGESTSALVAELFELRRLGVQAIRGRTEPLAVFEVVGKRKASVKR